MPSTMTPIAQMVDQLQRINGKPKRTSADRITPELRAEVLAAIQDGDTTRKIRATFGISHATLVKIRNGKG